MEGDPPRPALPAAPSRWTFLLVPAALSLWVLGSGRRSLWVDEFHSLHHVLRPDLASFLESVRSDNHPPLSFFLERLSVGLFGLGDLSLRVPSIACGLLLLVLLAGVARRLGPEVRLAPWLALASSYVFVLASEARMYALLALATFGALTTLARALERDGSGRWWLPLWIAAGLHAHYYFLHALAAGGLSTLAFLLLRVPRGERWGRLRPLFLPAAIGLLLWLPWALWGFRVQLQSDLPPGGGPGTPRVLVESVLHLFVWNASVGGEALVRGAAWPGAILAGVALLVGAARIVRRLAARATDPREALPSELLLVALFAVLLPLVAWTASLVVPRANYNWRYVSGAAAPLFVVAACGLAMRGAGWRRVTGRLLTVGLLATMTAVTLANALSGGREDFRRLVAFVLANAREGDVVVVKPTWDLEPRREETTWRYYLDVLGPPGHGHVPPDVGYDELPAARSHERAWVWFRDPYYLWVRRNLGEAFCKEERWEMGPGLTLHLFSEPCQGD